MNFRDKLVFTLAHFVLKSVNRISVKKYDCSNFLDKDNLREILLSEALGHKFNPSRNPDAFDEGEPVEYKNYVVGREPNSSFNRTNYQSKIISKPYWYFARFDQNYNIEHVWKMKAEQVLSYVHKRITNTKQTRPNPTVLFLESWIDKTGQTVETRMRLRGQGLLRRVRLVVRLGNLLSPQQRIMGRGRFNELLVASKIGLYVVPVQGGSDATDNSGRHYEILCSLEQSANFSMTHISEKSMYRIERNTCFYCGLFSDPLKLVRIFRVETDDVLEKIAHRRPWPKGTQSNINLDLSWVEQNGSVVWSR